jgi:hypothetical protein
LHTKGSDYLNKNVSFLNKKPFDKHMNHILNTFPLLEEPPLPETASTINPALAHSRIIWLLRASQSTQEEFALKFLKEEPQGDAFHATVAAILSIDASTGIRDDWLKLEIAVAAKKIDVNMAHIKSLYKHYSIAISKKRGEDSYMYKFPHEEDWTLVESEHDLSTKLATSAFPLVPVVVEQYSMLKRDKGAARMVEEAMRGEQSSKRIKV